MPNDHAAQSMTEPSSTDISASTTTIKQIQLSSFKTSTLTLAAAEATTANYKTNKTAGWAQHRQLNRP
jgi:hypothetical protein